MHLLLEICFQSWPLSKQVYKKGAKDAAVIHQVTLFNSAAENIFCALSVVREGALQLSLCMAAIQMPRYLSVSGVWADVPVEQLTTHSSHLQHTLRCMKELVHPVATPEPLLAICLQSEPAVLVAFCFVKLLACAQGSLPQIQWANSVWKRHSF